MGLRISESGTERR